MDELRNNNPYPPTGKDLYPRQALMPRQPGSLLHRVIPSRIMHDRTILNSSLLFRTTWPPHLQQPLQLLLPPRLQVPHSSPQLQLLPRVRVLFSRD